MNPLPHRLAAVPVRLLAGLSAVGRRLGRRLRMPQAAVATAERQS